MSDSERDEGEEIFGNQEELNKFFQTLEGDWLPSNSNQVTCSIAQYSHLFAGLNAGYPAKSKASNSALDRKQTHFQNSAANKQRLLDQQITDWKQQKDNQESSKRLTNKIQQILARRNQQAAKPSPRTLDSMVSSKGPTEAGQFKKNKGGKKLRRRAVVTRQTIEKAKIGFQYYNASADKLSNQRVTFKEIAQKLGVSLSEITNLYDEYSRDPLFSNRLKKIEQAQKHTIGPPGTQSHALNAQRLKFIAQLLRLNSGVSQRQIVKRVNQEDSLLQSDRKGEKIPINRKTVHILMKMGGFVSKKILPPPQRNINSPQFIGYRHKYVRRYLEITDDINCDIFFLGQYSFANMASLSSCSSTRRSTFVDSLQTEKNSSGTDMKTQIVQAKQKGEDQWGRNLQYLVVMSLQGLLYYQIFNNIFEEIDFSQTLNNIGQTMALRNPQKKKYLILQTSFLHKKDALQAMEKEFPVKIIFLPPQTPMLNPTEYLFNQIKIFVRSKVYKAKRSYADVLLQTLQVYRERNLKSFYSCIGPYVELSLKQLPFK